MIMKKILGSLLVLIASPVLAVSISSVDKTSIYPGEIVTFSIKTSGKKIKFPKINSIGKYPILGKTYSRSISSANGNQGTHIASKSYTFRPEKSLLIPAFNLLVNGKNEKTKPIKITLLKPSKSKAGDDFVLSMKVSKNEFFIGDKIKLDLILKHKKTSKVNGNININQLNIKGLSLKTNGKFIKSNDNFFETFILRYQVSAQKIGKIKIASASADIRSKTGNLSNIFNLNQSKLIKKIYSNSVTLNVKPLPGDLTIYGNFKIKTLIDKVNFKQGESLNLVLEITGKGNFEDIEDFNINIPGATIYKDDSIIKNNIWSQRFAIIAQDDFTIPGFAFSYFDKITQSKKTIATKDIKIKAANKITNNTKNNNFNKNNSVNNRFEYYYLLLGIIIGIVISFIFYLFKSINKNHINKDLVKQIKVTRNDKALFDLLLPLNSVKLSEFLYKLEENIYKNKKHKINKKAIINIIRENL